LFVVWSGSAAAQQEATSVLTVTVKAVASDAGKVCIFLFGTKDGWPTNSSKAVRRACAAPRGRTATFHFEKLLPGTYAAFGFHDEDSDGQIKKNFIGMPKEGVGASNDAGGMGGPSFKAASFSLSESKTVLSFSLRYL
jgi:uncharacterized protein (DUF2141 family)